MNQDGKIQEMKRLTQELNELSFDFDVFILDEVLCFEIYADNESMENFDAQFELLGDGQGGTNMELYNLNIAEDDLRGDSFPVLEAVTKKFNMRCVMENSFELESDFSEEEIAKEILKMNPQWNHNKDIRLQTLGVNAQENEMSQDEKIREMKRRQTFG
jgi:hypothetical protein